MGTLAWTQALAQTVVAITGGDPGAGFAPLPTVVAGVDFSGSTVTVQGVTFNPATATFVNNGGGGFAGTYGGFREAFSFSPADANNTAMAAMLDGFEYAATPQPRNI